MRIFRHVERILDTLVSALNSVVHPTDGRILVRTHVNDVVVALILHWTTRVGSLDGIVSIDKVLTRTSFITQTPDAHRGMIHRGMHHF